MALPNTSMALPKKQGREPFWRAFCSCWYVYHGEKRVRLSPDKDMAWKLWNELLARPVDRPVAAPIASITALEVIDQFLERVRANKAKRA